jgi:histidinol-phosphate aminotransferase
MSIIDSALVQIKQLHPYSPGKPVEELERELGVSNAFKLASNENPLGCSKKVKAAIALASEQIELYPDANAYYLKQQLAQKLDVKENQVTIGNGSNDVLDLIARTFLDSSRAAIFSEYAFMVYGMVTQACGARAQIATAFDEQHEQPLGHDLQAMLSLIDQDTSVIFIANPNNPTGTWLSHDALKQFIEQVPEHIAVVVDEAYFEYVELEEYPDSLTWIDQFPNLIVTRTFSKIYGLAGLRIGYAISSEKLCDLFNRVRQPFNGNSLALAAACAALTDNEFVENSRKANREGLQMMQNWFEQRHIGYIPSVGNFLTVKFGARSAEINQGLLQNGIIVRPVANYNMSDYLRISVGTRKQLEKMFAVLDKIL